MKYIFITLLSLFSSIHSRTCDNIKHTYNDADCCSNPGSTVVSPTKGGCGTTTVVEVFKLNSPGNATGIRDFFNMFASTYMVPQQSFLTRFELYSNGDSVYCIRDVTNVNAFTSFIVNAFTDPQLGAVLGGYGVMGITTDILTPDVDAAKKAWTTPRTPNPNGPYNTDLPLYAIISGYGSVTYYERSLSDGFATCY